MSDDDIASVEAMADSNGVVSKNNCIACIKRSNLFNQFDHVDTESYAHWNQTVKKAWELFDKNGDGKLTKREFRWMTDKKTINGHQIDLMFSKCDSNEDGVLDFEEFKEMLFRNRFG